MRSSPQKCVKINYLALAFAIPVVGVLVILLLGQCEPFSDNYSLLYSDAYHQYYPFFVEFSRVLKSGGNLLYNWSVGMGLDYLGLVSYYLASPLNLLAALLPESWLLEYFSLLMPIKLGLASLFFAIFLKKTFHRDDISISLFGAFYGLCAWALGYQWNIMWLDTFALLPLVAMGTVSLLRDKKFFLYTTTLFLSIFSNYYIGFFTCIFVLLVFICYQICCCRSYKRFFSDLSRIALFSLLAIGMTAILELPALAALGTTYSSVNKFPEHFALNIADKELYAAVNTAWKAAQVAWEENRDLGEACKHLWTAIQGATAGIANGMYKVAGNMGGGLVPSFKEGLPNLYCGVSSIMLAFLFLTSREIKLREKLCSVALLLFFMLSFIVRQLDYIWHGFHFTNMIPYRFSFLFSFVMLYMAYRAYLLRNRFRLWQVVVAAIATLGIFSCSGSSNDPVFLSYNLVFSLLYFGVLLYGQLRKSPPVNATRTEQKIYLKAGIRQRRYVSYGLCGVMMLELIMNLVNFGVNFPRTALASNGTVYYPRGNEYAASMIRYMKEDDDLFYRAETAHTQTLNDGALNGYNGISTFTSSANVKVTEFMIALGYSAKTSYNRYCFEESSPVGNLFLNLKYMIERKTVENNAYFDYIHSYGTVTLLENNAYLPLGFLTRPQLASVEFTSYSDRFAFQNNLLTEASGLPNMVWDRQYGAYFTTSNATVTGESMAGSCSYTTGEEGGYVTTSFTAGRPGLFCIDMTHLTNNNSFTVLHNGLELFNEGYTTPQMFSVCDVLPGDTISIRFTCKANQSGRLQMSAAILDEATFRQAYDVLAQSTLQLTSFDTTHIEGTIECNRDGLLYTSIPQDGNWVATVDGEPAQIVLIGNVMVGLALSEGAHTVAFSYENKAFSLGWKITALCALAFLGLTLWFYKPVYRKGKYEK